MTLVLGYRNEALTGPIVATAAVDGLGPVQLQNQQGGASTAWQTPVGTLTASLTLVRAFDTPWLAFALARTNLSPAATVTWSILAGGVLVYAAVTDGVVPGRRQIVHVTPVPVIGDTCVVAVSDPYNPEGFLNVPLLYAGAGFQPVRNYGYASAIRREAGTASTVTRAGAEYVRNDWQRRGFDLVLGALQPDEVGSIEALCEVAERGENILLVPNPASTRRNAEAVFGRLKPGSDIGYANNSPRTRSWRATIMERL